MRFDMKIAIAVAAISIFSTTGRAAPPNFSITTTLDTFYSTNAGFSAVPDDDLVGRVSVLAAMYGQLDGLFNYRFFTGTRSDRFRELSALNQDLAFYGLNITKPLNEFNFILNGIHIFVFDDFYSKQLAGIFDLSGRINRRLPIFMVEAAQWFLTPGVSVARRFSDVPSLERYEIGSSIRLNGSLWGGMAEFAAVVAHRSFDIGDRRDNNLELSAVWTTQIVPRVSVSLKSRYEMNWSNTALRSYNVFEIGPALTIQFSTE